MRRFVFLLSVILMYWSCRPESSVKQPPAPPPVAQTSSNNLAIVSHRYPVQDQQLYNSYRARANKAVDVFLYKGEDVVALAKTGQLSGDLIILEDLYQAHQLKQLGVIEPYNAGTFGDYVPSRYVDNEGYWAGLTKWTMGFVFRESTADLVKMRNYAGILDPNLKGKIAIAHPDSSGLISMIAGMIAAHGDKPAQIYLQTLKDQLATTPFNNDWEAVTAVANGQAEVALVNSSSYLRYKHSGNPTFFKLTEGLAWEVPLDANNDNYYNITPICLIKQSPRRDYAISMVEFLTHQENQGIFSDAYLEYPVNVFSQPTGLLDGAFNVPQGQVSTEMTENQLDRAATLVHQIFDL